MTFCTLVDVPGMLDLTRFGLYVGVGRAAFFGDFADFVGTEEDGLLNSLVGI